MKWSAKVDYGSAWGKFAKGDELELDDDTSAWLLRDAPGCIEPLTRAVVAPDKNRQVTAAPATRVVKADAK